MPVLVGKIKFITGKSHEEKQADVNRKHVEKREALDKISEWQSRQQRFQGFVLADELLEQLDIKNHEYDREAQEPEDSGFSQIIEN